MRRTATFLIVTAGVLAAGPAAHALEQKTWDYAGGGRWPLVEPRADTNAVDNPILDKAEALLEARDAGAAEELLVDWIKGHRTAPDRDRALFLLADSYYRSGDRIKAFYQLDEILDTYPESRLFYPALEKQYVIADDYLKGYKRKFLGLHLLPATDDGIDMLYRVQERSPGSPLAERAMLRTADFYYNTGQFDLAGDVYSAYLRSYPRSPDQPRVRLRRAFSAYAQFKGTRYEAAPLIEARTQLEDIKVKYPEMAAEVNVQKFIDDINTTLAQKLIVTADFYRRTGYPAAAAVTYRQLLDSYPDTREARAAEAALAALPPAAREQSMPPAAKPFEVPSTQSADPLGPPAPTGGGSAPAPNAFPERPIGGLPARP